VDVLKRDQANTHKRGTFLSRIGAFLNNLIQCDDSISMHLHQEVITSWNILCTLSFPILLVNHSKALIDNWYGTCRKPGDNLSQLRLLKKKVFLTMFSNDLEGVGNRDKHLGSITK
jgi:hypothetical protein